MAETFGQLLARTADHDILAVLEPIEPNNIVGYKEVLTKLRTMTPLTSDITVHIEPWLQKDVEDHQYYDVYGHEKGSDVPLAIEFTPWREWLAMPYRVVDCDLTEAQIVAWCLWEMTWAGWDPEAIEEHLEEIVELKDEAISKLENE